MKKLFFVFLLATVCGCSYGFQSREPVTALTHEPPKHRRANSVGNLRRLVMMSIEIKPYSDQYNSPKDLTSASKHYENACSEYLTETKGYEIIRIGDANGKRRSEMVINSGIGQAEELKRRWQKAETAEERSSVITDIGRAFNADGVLAIQIKERRPWGVSDGLLNIAFMNIPLFYRIISPNIKAWIYETASGRLVWRRKQAEIGQSAGEGSPSGGTRPSHDLIFLFEDMQNALPPQLLK